MGTLVITSNASQGTDVTIRDMGIIIANSGGSQTFTDLGNLEDARDSENLRTLTTDDVHGAGSSTLILTDGTNTVAQADASSFLDSITEISPNRTIVVAQGGLQNVGYYTTIAAGIVAASALSPTPSSTEPASILVYPGIYSEANPLSLPAFVNLVSVSGPEATIIEAQTTTTQILNAPAGIRIVGFTFKGASGAGGVGLRFATSGARTRADSCMAIDCETGIQATGSGVTVYVDAGVILRRSGETLTTAYQAAAGAQMICLSCRANGESGTLLGTGFHATGAGSKLTASGCRTPFNTNGLQAETSGEIVATGHIFNDCTQNRRLGPGDSGVLSSSGSFGVGVTWDTLADGATVIINLSGDEIIQENQSVLTDATVSGFVIDVTSERALVILNELHVGLAEVGRESSFGEGDSYVRGMVVVTTDGTAGTTADGGNLTDVSASAASETGSTFTFQGVTAGHSILFGSSLGFLATATVAKHWGLKFSQTTAANEVTPKSFVFEIWDGAAWTAIGVMATQSNLYHRYGNEVFIRANNPEHHRYGIDTTTTWATKLISGNTLFWSRVRIDTTITTAPVFEQVKLHSSRSEINIDGTHTFHGKSRFRKPIFSGGNVFGETGGVTLATVTIGTGGLPTGWNHPMKNSLLNGSGDAIYIQMNLPRGIDTSFPTTVRLTFGIVGGGGSNNADLICSFLPNEVSGVIVADPAGGITPLARTLANTDAQTDFAAEADTTSGANFNTDDDFTWQVIEFGPFTVENYYEGDAVFIRVELDDDGTDNVDVEVVSIEFDAVFWTHGEKL